MTGKPEFWRNPVIEEAKITLSSAVITFMIGVVLVLVLSIFFVRVYLVQQEEDGNIASGWGGHLASVFTAVQIQVMSLVYDLLARKLTAWENQPTATAHDNSLVAKTSVFQFINAYFSLFFIAFLKNDIEILGEEQQCEENEDGEPDCMGELQSQLAIILITRLFIGNFQELAVPWILRNWNYYFTEWFGSEEAREEMRRLLEHSVSEAEEESHLGEYDSFADYLDQLVLFGYVSLFVVAFPLGPLLALVSNYVEIRVDSFKLLTQTTRPAPHGAQDIGAWFFFLEMISFASVATNLGVIVFTDNQPVFGVDSFGGRVALFILLEHGIFLVKYLMRMMIGDVPYSVKIQLSRQEYLVDKHFYGVVDEFEVSDACHLQELAADHGDEHDADGDDDEEEEGAADQRSEKNPTGLVIAPADNRNHAAGAVNPLLSMGEDNSA